MRKKQYRGPTITQQELKSVLNYDPNTGFFTWKKRTSKRVQIGDRAGADLRLNSRYLKTSYLQIMIHGRNYIAHRLAWLYVYGQWPTNMIDHINHNGLDNRIANLREATGSQNQMNRLELNGNNTSGVRGIYITKQGTYRATIRHKWKIVFSKTFPSMKQAKIAIAIARKKIFDPSFIAIVFASILVMTPAIAEDQSVCLTYKQARHLWPTRHIWWWRDRETGDRCWSNRRGGPPRHLKIEKEPEPKKEKKIKTDPIFSPKAEALPVFRAIAPLRSDAPMVIVEDGCCWPTLTEFDLRFAGVQP